jgi:hypothetical protein
MKIRALATVLALACGIAFAAQDKSTAAEDAGNRSQSATSDTGKGGAADKTSGTSKKSKTQGAAKSDTGSMGAAGSEAQEGARQQRMDDAYANWKSKQK